MIVIQISSTAMLFPILLPNFSTTAAIVFLTWPFLHLAGLLSPTPETNLLLACLYVSLWITGLRSCVPILHPPRGLPLSICLTQLFTLGTAILWYLKLESSPSAPPQAFGPLIGAVQQINTSKPLWIAWLEAALPLLIGSLLQIRQRTLRGRPPANTASPKKAHGAAVGP
jgi:hypothetical protein